MHRIAERVKSKQPRRGVVVDDKPSLHVKAIYDPKTKQAVASTATIDRMGEVIDQEGWDLTNYKANPVLLWAHNDREILIGNAKNIKVEKAAGVSRLVFEPDFHDKTDTARAIKELFEEGRMKTFSVGFMPLEMDGNTYTKSELLEISAVNVPANPDAMTMAYRSLAKKGYSQDVALDVSGIKRTFRELFKGAVLDELANPDDWEVKSDNMDDVFDIFYAFCDVYFDYETPVDDFQVLLKECVQLLGKVVNGTYTDPSEPVKVVDNNKVMDKTDVIKAKETPSAPLTPSNILTTRQSLSKRISSAADQLLAGEKNGVAKDERVKTLKIIKRASEILNTSHKGEINHG